MSLSTDVLLLACGAYVTALFILAFLVDRAASRGRTAWMRSPVVYTLSISVYCTSWTFYGAVGSAARNGLEFITIYLGPTLVFIGWWWILRKLVRIGREHRVTSIADLLSARYGKSPSLAVLVTLIALVATTPYIALQLQSVTRSYQVVSGSSDSFITAFWIALGMAVFAVLFGTRNLDANERHHGVVAAVAVEAVVKLVALIAVGVFVVASAGGLEAIFADVPTEVVYGGKEIFGPRWAALTFLAGAAIICLPRQFQVTVVENVDERHLATASWLFPAYLFGMCLFIMPIAIFGLKTLPEGSNPDLYVLTLPLAEGRNDLALLAFIGGFSSATSMVIVAAIAVSTMVSNHIVMPIALRLMPASEAVSGDLRNLLLTTRRLSIAGVLALGFIYFVLSGGSDALAAIGLIAFAGVAQFIPCLIGGIFWRGATRPGALAGLSIGAALWAYTLLLPSFDGTILMPADMIANGPFGIALLKPEGLLGLAGADPLVHALVWSLGTNVVVFLSVSALTQQSALDRLQGSEFVDVFRTTGPRGSIMSTGEARAEDLFILAQRILGTGRAQVLFDEMAAEQGRGTTMPQPTVQMIARLERELSGSIGAASAHAMVTRISGAAPLSVTQLIDIADETQRLIETSRALTQKSGELEQAANQLRVANERLRTLDAQRNDFLSQVSHELRTPMTSIRSFSEILLEERSVDDLDRRRFARIIHDESIRLTGLLDEILDLGQLEAGRADMRVKDIDAGRVIASAIATLTPIAESRGVRIMTEIDPERLIVRADPDRLLQVLINLLSNAIKYNVAEGPEVLIRLGGHPGNAVIDILDNGGGVLRADAVGIFDKFTRGSNTGGAQGAGLGLPISRAIMRAMDGDLRLEFRRDDTSFFRVVMPTGRGDTERRAQTGALPHSAEGL